MRRAGRRCQAGYTEKERDVETGYDYFGARYYDSRIGRWMSVDPLAEKYPGFSPFVYSVDNPIKFIDPNGREIRNAGRYVLSNPDLVSALTRFNAEIARLTRKSTKDYIFRVTGGDRYKDEVDGTVVHRSSTNGGIIENSDPNSPHLEENGARGIDLSFAEDVSWETIKKASKKDFSQALNNYKNGHFHLTLDMEKSSGELISGNVPAFEETRQDPAGQQQIQSTQQSSKDVPWWKQVANAILGTGKSALEMWNEVMGTR